MIKINKAMQGVFKIKKLQKDVKSLPANIEKISTEKHAEAAFFKICGLQKEVVKVSKIFYTSNFAEPLLEKLSRLQNDVINKFRKITWPLNG